MFNKNLILIISASVIFGLAGGILGGLASRFYLFESAFNIPVFRDIDLSGETGGSNFVISGAKTVIVEQDQKVADSVNFIKDSIIGIYKKKKETANPEKAAFRLDDYYFTKDQLGQGFIITSDGWIITEFLPEELSQLAFNEKNNKIIKDNIIANFAIIDRENEAYGISDVVVDESNSFLYFKIEANDLPVRNFSSEEEIMAGKMALAMNWEGKILISTISEIKENDSLVKSSDAYLKKIILNNETPKDLFGSYLFNLKGDLTGFIDKDGEALSIDNFIPSVRGLLEDKEIKRAKLGVNYINLSELINIKGGNQKDGALIYKNSNGVAVAKNSPAEIAGLKEGDIITSVNSIKLDEKNSLNELINKYLEGDTIKITYERAGSAKEIEIKFTPSNESK